MALLTLKKSIDLVEKEKSRELNQTYSINDTYQHVDETYNDSTNLGVLESNL